MKLKILLLILFAGSFSAIFGQADPGSGGITFDKSIFLLNQSGTLRVAIGNYTSGMALGTAVTPDDATFTITVPSVIQVQGPPDLTAVPFPVTVASQTVNLAGETIIVLTVPSGIPRDVNGYLTIPVIALKESAAILYATVRTDANLSASPSGDASPANNNQFTAVVVFKTLPVTLATFEAADESTTANLKWSTTEEVNSDRFDVEHSLNGKHWEVIGAVASNGESRIKQEYSFVHKSPAAGNNYYRLKMVDKNTTYAYSSIRTLNFERLKLAIYPNPVAEVMTIAASDWKTISNVQMLNSRGITVYNSGNVPVQTVDVKNLMSGIYTVKVMRTDGLTSVQKILVIR